ncbi:MAG: hypothetical protein ACK476_06880 [Fluviicola sp.]
MKTLYYLIFFALVLSACKEEPEETDENPIDVEKVEDPTISTDFNQNVFSSNIESDLLKEIHICDPNAVSDEDPKHPSCSPKFFKFFPLAKNIPLKDGFKLLIKAGVSDFPIRRLLIFQRENGALVKLNGFNGNIIEERASSTGYKDLIIRFPDNINNSLVYYNCLFQWKNGKYEYIHCEEIDEDVPRKIKAEYIDSMGVEIKKILVRNNMLF